MTTSNEKSLIAKAAEALLRERRRRWDNVHQGECITDARAVVEAVRDQISAYADWLDRAEDAKTALLSAIEDVAAMPCPGSPPTPLARYAFETAREKALALLRARAEALGATEAVRGCVGETRGNE